MPVLAIPAIARYEAGAASPSVRTLERLLYAVGQQLRLSAEPVQAAAKTASE